MVTTLNYLQHRLNIEADPVEREQLQLSIDKLTAALKRSVREHNEQLENDLDGINRFISAIEQDRR